MGFFTSLKGKADVGTSSDPSSNTQYTSGAHDDLSTRNEKRRMFGGQGRATTSNPFSQSSSSQHQLGPESLAPPPGPPPSHRQPNSFSPPPGPPPSRQPDSNPAPYHDWTVIPDTALLPPPPPLPSDYSPANNASQASAERAHAWCDQNPPYRPSVPAPQLITASQSGDITLEGPATFATTSELKHLAPGTWRIKTRKGQQDALVLGTLPLYFAAHDHPLHTEVPTTIYYEVLITSIADDSSGVAIGYAAKPYPPWRLPGWHRASLGVHGDDGRRFINDSWGGRDFVGPFQPGDVVGIGMRYATEQTGELTVKTTVFLTRNGSEEGSWRVDEERDERDEGVEGLQGELDMYPAVGVFGGVECEVKLKRDRLGYIPR